MLKAMAKKKKDSKKKRGGLGRQSMLIFGVLTALVFLPSTVLLLVGMLPTPFAFLADRTKKKSKVITVGAMNLAGCAPFLFELWGAGNDFDASLDIITDPGAIVVMYSAAAVGYLISWAMTGIVANIMYRRGRAREKAIQKRQKELVERWGREVTGDIPLDETGFPLSDKPGGVNKPG